MPIRSAVEMSDPMFSFQRLAMQMASYRRFRAAIPSDGRL